MEQKRTKFLNYINVFRGLAILLIIVGHTMQFGDFGSIVYIVNSEIVCGGTALFIFISGFLFQHLAYKFEYKNYLFKKWTNVVMPYLITAVPGLLFCVYFPAAYENPFDGLNLFVQIPALLSIGRVHNVPTWFIPMIVMFFLISWILLKLGKKNILYKMLPVLFLITVFLPRGSAEYLDVLNMSYLGKYLYYVKYILCNFVHFISIYVFGMYCSANKDTLLDKFYEKRAFLLIGMLLFSIIDIYLQYNFKYSNFTISKMFLTMLAIGYLKHYDEFILSHNKINKTLDFIARYSFGLFFVHWYWFFIYNQSAHLTPVLPLLNGSFLNTVLAVLLRFTFVTLASLATLYVCKFFLIKINPNINTRKFLGI